MSTQTDNREINNKVGETTGLGIPTVLNNGRYSVDFSNTCTPGSSNDLPEAAANLSQSSMQGERAVSHASTNASSDELIHRT